ncbi:MAG: hypothetical protein K1W35_14930 [Lachnospiraceae bacterium]
MDEYYGQINGLILDLLIPVRTEKKLNKEVFLKLCDILEKIEDEVRGKESIQRNIAGLIFFIYRSLSDEVVTNDYKNELFRAVGKLEDILDKIFWDSPFKE